MYIREWYRNRLPFPVETGRGVTIGIIDDVCGHPDITPSQARKVWFMDATEDNWTQEDFQKYIRDIPHPAHGLAVAGVAGSNGRFPGVAPDVNLLLIKAICKKGNRSVVAGIQEYANLVNWVIGKKDEYNLRVLVLTIAPRDISNMVPWQACSLARAVEHATDNNILVVTAAHNTPFCSPPSPAVSPSALTVGGVTGNPDAWQLYHHCWGRTIDGRILPEILAPADGPVPMPQFLKAEPKGSYNQTGWTYEPSIGPGYYYGDGTSEAAPFAAGTAALCLEANPGLSARDLKDILLKTAGHVIQFPPEKQGCGIVNPRKAVELAKTIRPGAERCCVGGFVPDSDIPKSLESAEAAVQDAALLKLFTGAERTPEFARFLIPLLKSREPKAVCAALLFMSDFNELRETVRDSGLENHFSPHVRCAWGRAVAVIDDRITVHAVRRLLKDNDRDVRLAASMLSAVSTDRELLPDLVKAMQEHGNWPVFCGARDSAERITGMKFECRDKSVMHDLAKRQQDIAEQWKQWFENHRRSE